MTFIVTFDLYSVLLMIALPAVIVFVCYLVMTAMDRIHTFVVGSYVKKTIERNNRLIKENRDLRKRLEDLE